jgi:NADPH:quinone reductase-like Zn-dependent oxidoreductase
MGRLIGLMVSGFRSRKLMTFLAKPRKADLIAMHDLMQTGKLKPVIDRCFPLSEVAQAIRHVEGKHARGKVVITLEL